MKPKLQCFTSNLKSNPVFFPNCNNAEPKHIIQRNQITTCEMGWYMYYSWGKAKHRPHGLTNVVFVVTSHYQSLQILALLLQACLNGSLELSHTLWQQLQWLQQDRWFRLYTRVSSAVVWKRKVLQVAWGKGRDIFSIKTVWRPFYTLIFVVQDRICIAPIALYKSYVSQSGVSIFDQNGCKVELVFVRRRF